ncbi:hypothetical protein D9M68_938880 [compost metagenome]
MDTLGQQLLAGTGFTAQQHRGVELRRASGLAFHFTCGRAGADETGDGVTRTARLGQLVLGRQQLVL